jgi:hypothetical protein
MKIKPGPVSRRSPVYEVQAHHLAIAIHQLADACARQFREEIELSLEDYYRFRGMPEYEHFIQATIVCGFVCTDYGSFFPLDKVHDRPNEVVPTLPFSKVRHYIHTLQRAEKWNSEYSTALWTAITSGALLLVARRLESDQSLYESDKVCDEEEI